MSDVESATKSLWPKLIVDGLAKDFTFKGRFQFSGGKSGVFNAPVTLLVFGKYFTSIICDTNFPYF